MSVSLNYDQMPISEKFLMLEELWENMSNDATQKGFTPQWHLNILEQREQNIQNGKSTFSELEEAKSRLQKLV
ncbi:conserved hypothetical protein [Sulfurimonas denitrificans DSM 1251]|uniref:Addiction module component n=1 Tax=Sulfurimonas denitrificans (strain ATCC 33889 / DSM 1251) TaxID=326298 RepID=Q30P72_SULDN|nr:addiction module protein [Sulfurimonas denitrificans]ABB45209.1 conserved hypothetical protein [Sulfurimonas denitrificans DSM 1251]MDD3443557.1 addiction module protein [Sulfurimonas denitrificans]